MTRSPGDPGSAQTGSNGTMARSASRSGTGNRLGGGRSLPGESEGARPLARWVLYAFVFAIPFETADIGLPFTLTWILGGLLLLAALLEPHRCLRFPPAAFWCFGAYFCMWVVSGFAASLWGAGHEQEMMVRLATLLQLIVLFWISYNLMRQNQVANTALWTLLVSCAIFAVLQVSGMKSVSSDVHEEAERTTALGENPNTVAGILAIGLLALVGLVYGPRRSAFQPRFLVWLIFALVGMAIVQTGSRGSILALGVGLLAFLFGSETVRSRHQKAVIILFGVACLVLLSYLSEITRLRFEASLETGSLARREFIYPTAWQMFLERPIMGWGPENNIWELGSRLHEPGRPWRDPHNLILYALTATGVVGTVPLLAGLWLCLRGAWRARAGPHGILPFAMMITLLAVNMKGPWHNSKLHWLVLAYALASAGQVAVTAMRCRMARPVPPRGRFAAVTRLEQGHQRL